jgi:hypothetical protein
MNPLQLYTQFIQQWQKACTDVIGFWERAGEADNAADPRRRY